MDIQEYVNGLEIKENPETKGYDSVIEYDGQHYYVSMADLLRYPELSDMAVQMEEMLGGRYELMIFSADENGNVTSWADLWVSRWYELSMEIFRNEVRNFLEEKSEQ